MIKTFVYEFDLMDYNTLKSVNSGYAYGMLCIDDFTKFVQIVPLKQKSAPEILRGFKEIFKVMKPPQKLITDGESAIKGKQVQKYLESLNVEWVHHYKTKAQTAERAIGTIKQIIGRYFKTTDTHNWVNDLEKFVDNYNENNVNRTTKFTADDAKKPQNEEEVRANLVNYYAKVRNVIQEKDEKKPKLSVGDRVRVLKKRNIFAKGNIPIWGDEVKTITGMRGSKFILDDNKRENYYRFELFKIEGEVRRDKLRRTQRVRKKKVIKKLKNL